MIFWLGFFCGGVFVTLLMPVLMVNADKREQKRAEFAIKKCKELQVDVESKQAEINRWEHLCKAKNMLIAELDMSCKADKTEAYKEFAEKVNENRIKYFNYIYSDDGFANITNNIYKELTERKED